MVEFCDKCEGMVLPFRKLEEYFLKCNSCGKIKPLKKELRDSYTITKTIEHPKGTEFSTFIISKNLEMFRNFLNFYRENIGLDYQLFYQEIQKVSPIMNIMFLNEFECKKLNGKLNELYAILNEIELNKKSQPNDIKSPYIFTSLIFNLNSLLEMKKLD